jgi:ribosomal protein S18 acetylase RimI-like enzyme
MQWRLARLSDVSSLVKIIDYAYRDGKETLSWTRETHLVQGPRISEQGLAEIINDSKKHLLVVEEEGGKHPLGCIMVEQRAAAQAYIGLLAVDPDQQSRGIGAFLLRAAESFARDQLKATGAVMTVLAPRKELIAWYKRMGFEPTGEVIPFDPGDPDARIVADNLKLVVIAKAIS